MSHDELTYIPRAQEYLSRKLNEGSLVIFLGAGASAGLGLPGWVDFINRLRRDVGLSELDAGSSADQLQLSADEIRERCSSETEYIRLLKTHLYEGLELPSIGLLRNELLIALGSMMMGSKRGSVRRIVSLNFDSMLEWYLRLHGMIARVVYKLPELEGSEDVRIYHPHGFLPHPSLNNYQNSDFVILGFDSVNERIGRTGDQWFEMVRYLLRSGVCLFVGLSERTFSDRSLAPLLSVTGKELGLQRPTGFWLLKDGLSPQGKSHFLRNNVVPLVFTTNDEIVGFLLGICQEAADAISA